MRHLTLSAFALTLLAGMPALAQEPGLMTRLDRYCLATNGDADEALRSARADGFVIPPLSALPPMPPEMKDVQALWTAYDGGAVFLLAGHMRDRRSPLQGDVCALAVMPPGPEAVKQVEQWLGSPLTGRGYAIYTDDGRGGRRVLQRTDEEAAQRAMSEGSLRAIGARSEKQMTLVMVIKLRPPVGGRPNG